MMKMPASANKPSSGSAKSFVKSGGVAKKIVANAKGKHGMAMKKKAC